MVVVVVVVVVVVIFVVVFVVFVVVVVLRGSMRFFGVLGLWRPFYSRRPTATTTKTTKTTTTTTTATTTKPKAAASTPTGPRLARHQNACGATPDLCSPFGLVAGRKRRAVL